MAGCETVMGDNGHSRGCYQVLESTWEMWADMFLGYTPQTVRYATQRFVVIEWLKEKVAQGYRDDQIALLYNHPASGGTQCGSGYNYRVNVSWNSCEYVAKVVRYLAYEK